MTTFITKDGTGIFYKDWGSGQPILFAHGWPLSSDAWDQQMLFFSQNGFRVIAHDRRSHGRSDQTFHGNNMDQYADDLAELIESLDLKDLILVGHSTGAAKLHIISAVMVPHAWLKSFWSAQSLLLCSGRMPTQTVLRLRCLMLSAKARPKTAHSFT